MRVRPYTPADRDAWDALIGRSVNGTFLHTRDYLAISGERFADASLLIEDHRGRSMGVVPAAAHPSDRGTVETHPAVGYAGILHDGSLRGERMLEALEAAAERLHHEGHAVLRYKLTPAIYHRTPAADDSYALHRLGATRTRCDLAAVVDLAGPGPVKLRRAKAARAGVRVTSGAQHVREFWPVLTARLETRGGEPGHTLEQMEGLVAAFPDRIRCIVGSIAGDVVAGAVCFETHRVTHTQYLAADDRGHATAALDLVLGTALDRCTTRYFSLGNSTLYGGRVFMDGQLRFKSRFGAGSSVFEAYDLALR